MHVLSAVCLKRSGSFATTNSRPNTPGVSIFGRAFASKKPWTPQSQYETIAKFAQSLHPENESGWTSPPLPPPFTFVVVFFAFVVSVASKSPRRGGRIAVAYLLVNHFKVVALKRKGRWREDDDDDDDGCTVVLKAYSTRWWWCDESPHILPSTAVVVVIRNTTAKVSSKLVVLQKKRPSLVRVHHQSRSV